MSDFLHPVYDGTNAGAETPGGSVNVTELHINKTSGTSGCFPPCTVSSARGRL